MSSMVTGEASGVAIAEMTMSATYTVRHAPRSLRRNHVEDNEGRR